MTDMKRRDVFKLGARKTAEIALRLTASKAARRAENWLRPPFALEEFDFLLTCTRCDQCIDACEYDVLFSLSAGFGIQAAGTPAMDLRRRGCHMCEGWPCVSACEPRALELPVEEEGVPAPPPLRLSLVRIDEETCLPFAGPECGACAHACPVPGALEWVGGTKPRINQDHCTGCALCREACIVEPKAITVSAPLKMAGDDAISGISC